MSAQPKPELRRLPEFPPDLSLVLERFLLRARLRAEWLQILWKAEGEPGGRLGVTHGEARTILDDLDSPEAEWNWQNSSPDAREVTASLRRVEDALEQSDGRLKLLTRIFGLSDVDGSLLQACLAIALDPALARLCAYLQDQAGRAYITEELTARLYTGRRTPLWNAESGLSLWDIVVRREGQPGEPAALTLDPAIRDWVRGRENLPESLATAAQIGESKALLPQWNIDELTGWLRERLQPPAPAAIELRMEGPSGSGRRTLAAEIARRLGFPLLVVNADRIEERSWQRAVLHAERHAFLTATAIAYSGETLTRRTWPQIPALFPLRFVIAEPGQSIAVTPGVVERRVAIPALTPVAQRELWRQYVPQSSAWPREEMQTLHSWRHITPGDIVQVGRARAADAKAASRVVRKNSRSRFGDLAELLPCPFTWDDLVVDPALREGLEDFVFEARERAAFWDRREARRQFPQGRGLLALLSGPPGVGKTMAAQVIAAALGPLDLFRVNLATTVSKWVGETAKNFDAIIRRGAMRDCVLLFDECDAAFARRTSDVRDAQDRFVNTDTAHLLQAVESFPGIALLATNQKGSVDPAFVRRIRFVLEFPRPDADRRQELWRKTLQALAGDAVTDGTLRGLGEIAACVEVTGAQIKFAALTAVFSARKEKSPVATRHLLKGLERELVKEGRSIDPRERERMLSRGV